MSEEQEITYWACDEPEELVHEEKDDAIEDFLDNIDMKPLPATIEVMGYKRATAVVGRLNDYALEGLLEALDERYNCSENYPEATEGMKEAATKFVETVLKDYEVFNCDEVIRETIDVAAWVTANAPYWLEENPPVKIEGQ